MARSRVIIPANTRVYGFTRCSKCCITTPHSGTTWIAQVWQRAVPSTTICLRCGCIGRADVYARRNVDLKTMQSREVKA